MGTPAVLSTEAWSEYPREYESLAGTFVAPGLDGAHYPIPPAWVREHANVPQRVQYATLAPMLEPALGREARQACIRYVRDWPTVLATGQDLLLYGDQRWRLEFLAAGVVHEVTRLYAPISALSTAYLHHGSLLRLLAAREHKEDYLWRLNRLITAKLLTVFDVSELAQSADSKMLLAGIYTERAERKLPTITTLNLHAVQVDWPGVERRVGSVISDALTTLPDAYRVHA